MDPRSRSSRRSPGASPSPPLPGPAIERPAEAPEAAAARLLAMQRAAGNHAVARLLHASRPHDSRLRRTVTHTFRGQHRPVANQNQLNEKVRGYWNQYGPIENATFPDFEAVKLELTDAAIAEHTQGFLTDATPRTVRDVAVDVFTLVRERSLRRRLASEGSSVLPGVKVAVSNPTATTDGISPSTRLPGNSIDLHAPFILFRAVVSVDGTPAALQGWQVGLTQTVLHVDRRFAMRVDAQDQTWAIDSTTALAAPANDRNAGSTAPWYNAHSALDSGTVNHAVTLGDKPGEEFSFGAARVTGVQREGTDRFGTWLILWHPATQRVRFLGGWTWSVDYGHEAGTRTQVSAYTSRVGTGADPPEAVLGGPRCADVLTSAKTPPRPITALDQQQFDAAARNDATRKAFTDACATFKQALTGSDPTALGDGRDRAIAAWRGLQPEQRPQREGELLRLLHEYESRVNRRGPSQDALRDRYNVR